MKQPLAFCLSLLAASSASLPALAGGQNNVIISCGASSGYSLYLGSEAPESGRWVADGMSNGQIHLSYIGDGWDIAFTDAFGSYSYRQDGALVTALEISDGFISVLAAHQNYVDVYAFDLAQKQVAWTSTKTGTPVPKVSAMRATCG